MAEGWEGAGRKVSAAAKGRLASLAHGRVVAATHSVQRCPAPPTPHPHPTSYGDANEARGHAVRITVLLAMASSARKVFVIRGVAMPRLLWLWVWVRAMRPSSNVTSDLGLTLKLRSARHKVTALAPFFIS